MIYFWLIPVLLLALVVIAVFFRDGTRRRTVRRSRLEEAQQDLREHG